MADEMKMDSSNSIHYFPTQDSAIMKPAVTDHWWKTKMKVSNKCWKITLRAEYV